MEGFSPTTSVSQRMPVGRKRSAADMQDSRVQDEAVDLGQQRDQLLRKAGQHFDVVGTLTPPSYAGNAHLCDSERSWSGRAGQARPLWNRDGIPPLPAPRLLACSFSMLFQVDVLGNSRRPFTNALRSGPFPPEKSTGKEPRKIVSAITKLNMKYGFQLQNHR